MGGAQPEVVPLTLLFAALLATASGPGLEQNLARLAGVGGVHVEDDSGAVLASWHADDARLPASVLKLATAAAVLHALGPDARLTTDFVYEPTSLHLCVVGGGDPFLVTESLRRAADSLTARGVSKVDLLSADCSLFQQPMEVDGKGHSSNPYDAALSALSVNFNTVAFRVRADGSVVQGEPETPLTPMAREFGRGVTSPGVHRVPIHDGEYGAPRYALELLREILLERGVAVRDTMVMGPCRAESVIVYRHPSVQTVAGTVAAMLEYSNNMIANMLVLSAAAKKHPAPVGLEDGVQMLEEFLRDQLALEGFVIREGSGLSRGNRMTARQVVSILHHLRANEFDELLPLYNGVRAKTGTLNGVTCLAGYFDLPDGRTASFALLLEGSVGLRDRVLALLRERLSGQRNRPQ